MLLIGFAVIMIATAVAMLRGRETNGEGATPDSLPVFKMVLEGLVVGLVTGLVGAGGGFLVVPALALLGGLSKPVAVGTSLVVIAMKSFAGLAGYLSSVHIDWRLATGVIKFACTRYAHSAAPDHGSPPCRRSADLTRTGYPRGYHGCNGFRKEYDDGW